MGPSFAQSYLPQPGVPSAAAARTSGNNAGSNLIERVSTLEKQVNDIGHEYTKLEEYLHENEQSCSSLKERFQAIESSLAKSTAASKRRRDDNDSLIVELPTDKIAQELINRLGQGELISPILQRQLQASIPLEQPHRQLDSPSFQARIQTSNASTRNTMEAIRKDVEPSPKRPRSQQTSPMPHQNGPRGNISAGQRHRSIDGPSRRSVDSPVRKSSTMQSPSLSKDRRHTQPKQTAAHSYSSEEAELTDGETSDSQNDDPTTPMECESDVVIPGERRSTRMVTTPARRDFVPWSGVDLRE